jgi:tetratricopeptide (TPR) repeat protein
MSDAQFQQLQEVLSDRYALEGELGRGGMGAVYRARHLRLDSPVAIKVLPVPASLGADELARFRREAMLAARLPNPHIVPVYEFEIRGDLAYLVMPLVDGVSLAQRLAQEGPLSYGEARELLNQVGGALAFAHERGIIHRDVKPANILWEPANRRWLITDFGIARPVERTGDDITSQGAVLGTPAYMAPEQATGGALDGRTDMYALAVTVCEALTGKRLQPLTDPHTALSMLEGEPQHLRTRSATALVAPLSLKPDARPTTMRDWLALVAKGDRGSRRSVAFLATAAAVVTISGLATLLWPSHGATGSAGSVIAVVPFGDATSLQLGTDIGKSFAEELLWVPEVQVIPPAALGGAIGDADLLAPGGRDSGAARVFADFPSATGVLTGALDGDSDNLVLTVQLRRRNGPVTTPPPKRGPADSLSAMVSAAVLDLFAPAEGAAHYRPVPPGGGLAAWSALHRGDSLFRAADYDDAIAQFDRVLNLDSTYALAAFKRMLAEVMRAQPTRASRGVRSALALVRRYRDNLDPLNKQLLEVYEILLTDGDVERAHRRVRDLTDQYPLAVDAWFVRGYLEFYFGPLFGTPPASARYAFEQAAELDPKFAVVHGLLAWIAVHEGNDQVARRQLREYLALDSTSTWAQVARLADSLRFRGAGAAVAAMRRLDDRSPATLELLALAGKGIRLEHAERVFLDDAARVLRDQATTADERANAFRLQLGNALGTGQAATVDTLFREAGRRNVPREEVDRAMVLLTVTGLQADIGRASDLDAAAARLATDTVNANAPWLAARWFRGRDDARARAAARVLRRMAARTDGRSILARSLVADLDAHDSLATGDTAAAFRLWSEATQHYQLEEVPFGLVASLWPLRLDWARAAAAKGDPTEVLLATATFEQSPGFMDQVARPVALPLRADALYAAGDRLAAQQLRRQFADVLRDATGRWRTLRDALLVLSGDR